MSVSISTNTDFQEQLEDSDFIRYCREPNSSQNFPCQMPVKESRSKIKSTLVKNIISNVLKNHSKIKLSRSSGDSSSLGAEFETNTDFHLDIGRNKKEMAKKVEIETIKDMNREKRENIEGKIRKLTEKKYTNTLSFGYKTQNGSFIQAGATSKNKVESNDIVKSLERKKANVDLTKRKDYRRPSQNEQLQIQLSSQSECPKNETQTSSKCNSISKDKDTNSAKIKKTNRPSTVCFGRDLTSRKNIAPHLQPMGSDLMILINGAAQTISSSTHLAKESRNFKPKMV